MSNKKSIKELIVVEGKTDISLLSSRIDAFFFRTNGYALTKEDIAFINLANEYIGVILLLDPDGPGNKIKQKILNIAPSCKVIDLNKKECIKKNKVGVAESNIESTFLEILKVATVQKERTFNISKKELCECNLIGSNNSKNTRDRLSKALNINLYNSKDLFLKLNCIKINKEQIINYVK